MLQSFDERLDIFGWLARSEPESDFAYNSREVSFRCSNRKLLIQILAVLCIGIFLTACIAVPLHKHDSSQEGICLICHATERANVVAIHSDAGKPYIAPAVQMVLQVFAPPVLDGLETVRTPRAPPSIAL